MDNLFAWFRTVKRDWIHRASGTSYYRGYDLPTRAYVFALLKSEFQLVIFYRIYSAIYRTRLRVVGLLIYFIVKFLYKCDIHPKSKIGPGLFVAHGFDIVIGSSVELGMDTVVFNGVNMGKKYVGVAGGAMPKLGNCCVVGTGAKLLGNITLGDRVVVGANAVVLQDIPSDAVCAGIPAKVIKLDAKQ